MCKKLSILFCVTFITMALTTNIFAEGNLIKNGSFEDVEGGVPKGWSIYSYIKDEGSAEFNIEADGSYSGSKCATIANKVENDSRYVQTISVQPNKNYRLSCYIKGENMSDSGNGAVLSVEGQVGVTTPLRNTDDLWEYAELYVKTEEGINTFNVTVGVGGYGAVSTGKAYFDEVTAEEVDNIPVDANVAIVKMSEEDTSNSDTQSQQETDSVATSESEKKSGTNKTVWIILAICILIAAAATYNTFKSSTSEENNDLNDSTHPTDDKELLNDLENTEKAEEPNEDTAKNSGD